MSRRRVSLFVSSVAIVLAVGYAAYVGLGLLAEPGAAADWFHLSSSRGDLPVPGSSDQQTASLVLDIDRDGIDDFVVAARKAPPALVWFRRRAGGWDRYVIDHGTLDLEAGGASHDIDGDGDLDIVMGEDYKGAKVYWWQNPNPDHDPEVPWRRFVIKNSGAFQHHDQIFGDFDNDGRSELAFWNQGARKLFIAEIPATPEKAAEWPMTAIFEADTRKIEGLAQADIDGDGDIDLIGGGRWFEHVGQQDFVPHVIDAEMAFSRAAAGQLVEGGRPEIVFAIGDDVGRLKWYQWTGAGWVGHDLLQRDLTHGHSLQVADVNGDGAADIFVAEMHTPGAGSNAMIRLFLGDGKGGFDERRVARGIGGHESRVADLDGDGDLDILVKPYHWQTPRVDVLLNRISTWDRWRRHVIDDDRPWRSIFITSGDLDGDGYADILAGAWWYRNPGSPSGQWKRYEFGAPHNNLAAVADFDMDGDLDVLGTKGKGATPNAEFVWARNAGNGDFTILDNIEPGNGDFLQGVAVGRLGSGRLSVALSWHESGKGVQALIVPDDPATQLWQVEHLTDVSQDEALSVGDIDGDGTADLLLGTKWLRRGTSGWEDLRISGEPNPDRNRLADIDGDGRLDAVVGFEAISAPGVVAWYEQPPTAGEPWTRHEIARVIGPMSLDVGDIDQDGDPDVVVGEHDLKSPENAKMHIFDNADGAGGGWIGHIISVGDEHHDGAVLVDIDNDTDLDVVSIGWSHGRVLLYENRMNQ